MHAKHMVSFKKFSPERGGNPKSYQQNGKKWEKVVKSGNFLFIFTL